MNTKARAAFVALLILAGIATNISDPGRLPELFFAAASIVAVGGMIYRERFKIGQRDPIDPPHIRPLTEVLRMQVLRTQVLMGATLPAWRWWLGYAVFIVPNIGIAILVFRAVGCLSTLRYHPVVRRDGLQRLDNGEDVEAVP